VSDTLLAKWLLHYDPIHRGWTPAGIANGVCATCGFSFPRIRGGYNLRRSGGGVPGASEPMAGAAGCDAVSIRTFPWVAHAPSTSYTYRLFAIGGGGVESLDQEASALAAFDAAGEWLGADPNPPADLRVASLAGGRFLVSWTHSRAGEQAEPGEFRLYHDGGTGQIDFESPVAVVLCRQGRFHHEYVSTPFVHGARVRWAVRTVSAEGVEERNLQQATGRAEAMPPPAHPAVILICQDS